MRRLFIILGLIVSITAVVLSATPLSKFAFIPAVLALVFGLVAFYYSRQKQYPRKSIQLIFILTIIALAMATYNSVFEVVEVTDIEELEQKSEDSESDAIEELEGIEIDDEMNEPLENME